MKFLAALTFLFFASLAPLRAQVPCTPTANIRLQLPPIGNTTVWGQCLNNDFTTLDTLLGGTSTLAVSTSSPSIAIFTNWVTANVAPVNITAFTFGFPGKTIRVFCGATDIFTSIAASADISIQSPWSCATSASITLTLIGSKWVEVNRQGFGTGAFTMNLGAPQLTDSGNFQWEPKSAVKLKRLSCSTDSGSVSINFDIRTEAAPNSPGTPVLSTPLVCSTLTGVTVSFSQPNVPAQTPVALLINAVAGAPAVVRLTAQY